MILPPLFSIEELDSLDEKQLEILKYAVQSEVLHEIRTNTDLRNLLREKLLPLYNQLRPQGRTRRARGSRPPRTPGQSS